MGGIFVTAKAGWVDGVLPPIIAEARGLRDAFRWAIDQHQSHIIFEIDSQEAWYGIQSHEEDLSSSRVLLDDCKQLLLGGNAFSLFWAICQVDRAARELA